VTTAAAAAEVLASILALRENDLASALLNLFLHCFDFLKHVVWTVAIYIIYKMSKNLQIYHGMV
jgi:hypothetical protein